MRRPVTGLAAALSGLQSNVERMVRDWNTGDLEHLAELELQARRHLALVRQLVPTAQRAHCVTNQSRRPLPVAAAAGSARPRDWAEWAAGEQ